MNTSTFIAIVTTEVHEPLCHMITKYECMYTTITIITHYKYKYL